MEARVHVLIKEDREGMVLGNLNACVAVQDHCEVLLLVARGPAEGLKGEEGFWEVDRGGYIRNWLIDTEGSGSCMVDIVRRFWPTRKGCIPVRISSNFSDISICFLG